ncbi:hypothetical protein BV898_18850 [Hypsibius exemplaris]|uniref:Uncharacterized protein n=1 Tax=Hypsibius exemplaris TaxID=2072580 RepID=A0A9X6NKE8_HYPEX|nr:hypothetical protein BV898_18850 [Hypsibius exemplaris]
MAKGDLLMANVCDVPDVTEKAMALTLCIGMADGKDQDMCSMEVTKAAETFAVDLVSNHKSIDRPTEYVNSKMCCYFQNIAACHRPIFQEKCTGPLMATLVDLIGGYEPVAVLDNLIEEIYKIYNCDKEVLASCPQSTWISDEDTLMDEVENVEVADIETTGGDEEPTEAGSCDVMKCVTPIKDVLWLAKELATSQLQREIDGDTRPVPFDKNLAKNVCKKVQGSVTCFANYSTNCVVQSIPYLQILINNILVASEACDRPNFYDKLEIFFSCEARGPEFDRCQTRLHQLQLAIIAGLKSNPSAAISLVTDDMREIQRMICCATQEFTDCYDEAFILSCPSRAESDLWLSYKDSYMGIFSNANPI